MKSILTATELLHLAFLNQQKWIEAELLLNFNGKATHFLLAKKSSLLDEGVDGELTKWEKDDFISHYKNSQWIINQVA